MFTHYASENINFKRKLTFITKQLRNNVRYEKIVISFSLCEKYFKPLKEDKIDRRDNFTS